MSATLSSEKKESVVLINEKDEVIGQMEKIEAHHKAFLHRAFSIFIFNKDGEWLLQQRALSKYHSAGLWSNACCGHPRFSEEILMATHRRLFEEMGFDCDLKYLFKFQYFAPDIGPNITENEIDHVFIGKYNGKIIPNSNEVMAWKWVNLDILTYDMRKNSDIYTFWLKTIFEKVKQEILL